MKIARLISIIIILLENRCVSASYLAGRFEVSTRTIYRDMDAINMAGIPIVSHAGKDGGFSILPQYKIDKKIFSVDDIVAILAGLESVSGLISIDDIRHATIKLKSLVPVDMKELIELKSKQVVIDTKPWHYTHTSHELVVFKKSMQDSRQVQIDYRNAKGEISQRTIEPYRLVLKESRWYLYAYCLLRQEFRWFKIARMQNIILTEEYFTPRDYDPEELKAVPCNNMIVAKLIVNQNLYEVISGNYGNEHITLLPDGSYLVDFYMPDDTSGYDMVISFGTDCLDVEPIEIKDKIKRRILEIYQNYK